MMQLHRPRFHSASSSSPASGFPPRPLAGSPADPAPTRPAFLTEAGFPPPASVTPYGWTSPWLAKVAQRAVLGQYAAALEVLEGKRMAASGDAAETFGWYADVVRLAYARELTDPEPER